jgi:CheY-like chemotaxis protein
MILAALSHEFRTPLNGVLGMTRLLAGTRLDAAQKSYVAALEQSGEHLLGLVNQVLDLARLEAGRIELRPAPVDLEHLLQGVAEIMSPRAHAKGLEIACAVDPGLPSLLADEARLRQVLFNLVGNAVKFSCSGGVLLTAEPGGAAGRVRLCVRDTGPGVSEEERQRIFEPFAQGRASAAAVESTGLGLAIVSRIAKAMGAEVGLDAAPGGGAAFWIEARFETCGPSAHARPLRGLPVAIVSENALLAEAAARLVRACGGEPLIFSNAKAAAAAPADAPALVDFAADSKRRPRPLAGRRSIVLVGAEMRARIPALRKSGFEGYLIKPLRRQSVATRLLAVSGGPAGKAEAAPVEDERARLAAAPGARVLLAEDNPINAMLARALLEREGCTVDEVRTGPEALEAARAGGYDLILLDLRMPGMGGVDAARAMRRAGVSSPLAALTADAFEDARRACLEAGMDDFLTKPLEPAALHALLGRLLRPGFTDSAPDAKLAS